MKHNIRNLFCRLQKRVKGQIKNIWYGYHWRIILIKRSIKEYCQRFFSFNIDLKRINPYVIYMTGMPRTGSSFMKNYLGDYEELKIMPFQPSGFFINWKKSIAENGPILVDKSTHYIRHLNKIISVCNSKAIYTAIVRDPRDQLVSLLEFERHPELPRNKKFWVKWYRQYSDFIKIAKRNPNCRFFLIRYEDLVRYPIEAKFFFIEWVGFSTNGKVFSSNYSIAHKDDIQDDKVKVKHFPSTRSIGRFISIKDPYKKELVENYNQIPKIRSLMTAFGYLPELRKPELELPENIIFFTPKCP